MIKTKDLTKAAIFVALIAISAQITIPLPYVPFTLQLFTVSLTAYLLNQRQLILTLTVYIILGLVGFPVFAGISSGFLKPTIGFIIGFLPFALLLKKSKVLALFVLYAIGLSTLTLYFYFVLNINISFSKLVFTYGLIFIPTDVIAIYLAKFVSTKRFF